MRIQLVHWQVRSCFLALQYGKVMTSCEVHAQCMRSLHLRCSAGSHHHDVQAAFLAFCNTCTENGADRQVKRIHRALHGATVKAGQGLNRSMTGTRAMFQLLRSGVTYLSCTFDTPLQKRMNMRPSKPATMR